MKHLKQMYDAYRCYVLIPAVKACHKLIYFHNYRDPFEPVWVDPMCINYALPQRKYRKYARIIRVGLTKKGNWDNEKYLLTNEQLFVMMIKRYQQKMAWKDISEVKEICEDLNNGKRRLKCNNIAELYRRLDWFDAIAQKIKASGYKTQKELGSKKIWDEVRVAVSRNGDYLFIDGRHRLAIARALKIKHIPVIVSIKHSFSSETVKQ